MSESADIQPGQSPIDVLIITHNEAMNLPHCLEALQGWVRRVFVIDSGSTDGTLDLARQAGAEVHHHDWPGYAAQRNWAIDHLPLDADWTLILDADEVVTPKLRAQIEATVAPGVDAVSENGFYLNRLTYFLGKPIRHCGYYPSWNLRLFKRGAGRYENRQVHEHVIIDNPLGYLREPMIHHDRRGIEHFYAKHNRYSTLEATELFREIRGHKREGQEANLAQQARRRRWLKQRVSHRIPFPGLWRFVYMYIVRLGFLDGRTGYKFCQFIGAYDGLVSLKLRDMLRRAQDNPAGAAAALPESAKGAGLANPEGTANNTVPGEAAQRPTRSVVASVDTIRMQPESSPWSFKAKLGRAIWMLAGRPLFRYSFHNWYGYRNLILRSFGGDIGKRVRVRATVNIEIPWTLTIRDDATVGDWAILYGLGQITIGERAVISQYSHVCAGTHDHTDPSFRLLRLPITIGPDVWLGADSFVGPNVTIGALSVVGARSSVYSDLPSGKICVGNPAKPIKDRSMQLEH